jgi:hypothetical protein
MMAVDWNQLKSRYLQDNISTRLGGIASNLARARLLDSGANEQVALQLLRESQFLIEWTAPDASEDVAVQLVELQRLLSYWHYHWSLLWFDPEQRQSIAHQAQEWFNRLLDYSGLLAS